MTNILPLMVLKGVGCSACGGENPPSILRLTLCVTYFSLPLLVIKHTLMLLIVLGFIFHASHLSFSKLHCLCFKAFLIKPSSSFFHLNLPLG